MEAADAALTCEKAMELASAVDIVLYFVGSDLASACARAKQEIAYRFRQHNKVAVQINGGVILCIDGQCIAHILHRELEAAFRSKELIGRLYATAFSCSVAGISNNVLETLQSIVEDDLRTGFPQLAPALP